MATMFNYFGKKDRLKKNVHDLNWIDLSDFIFESGNYAMSHSVEMIAEVKRRANGNPQKAYESLLEVCDEKIDEFESIENRHCCCKRGCSYCCYQAIYLSQFEWKMLLYLINRMTRNERKAIKIKAEANLEKIKSKNIPIKLTPFMDETANNKLYLKQNIPCPLLGEDGACLVYRRRPLACHSFRNYGISSECEGKIPQNSYTFDEYHPAVRLPIIMEFSNTNDMLNMNLLSYLLAENL